MRPSNTACAYCRKHPIESAHAPFCSERCRMCDLGRWLNEDYRVPGEPVPFETDEDAGDERERD